MEIHIPENLGGELQVLPEGAYTATVQDLFLGTSKAGAPKLTVKWCIVTEAENPIEGKTTVGEKILENYSLQPPALWNLNGFVKDVTGKDLAQGDYTDETLEAALKEILLGVQAAILVVDDVGSGEVRSRIDSRNIIEG